MKYYRKKDIGFLMTIDFETTKEFKTDEIRKFIKDFFTSFESKVKKREEIFYEFSKNGITYIAVLSESHMAIHTFPEINLISIDIYFCKSNKRLFKKMEEFIINWFIPIKGKSVKIIKRGIK